MAWEYKNAFKIFLKVQATLLLALDPIALMMLPLAIADTAPVHPPRPLPPQGGSARVAQQRARRGRVGAGLGQACQLYSVDKRKRARCSPYSVSLPILGVFRVVLFSNSRRSIAAVAAVC